MRTSLMTAVVLLILVTVGGILTAEATAGVSDRYVSASRELLILSEDGAWARAADVLGSYQQTWDETLRWLQMLINHDDTDDVTTALTTLEAGIRTKDVTLCTQACNALQESARHIFHRDAFTLSNIL